LATRGHAFLFGAVMTRKQNITTATMIDRGRRVMSDTPIMMGNTKQQVITGVVKIAKPEFDITKHSFEKEEGAEIETYIDSEGNIKLYLEICHYEGWANDEMVLNRDDAIAIARHFKLTEGDLTC